jgi:TonB-dependent starch-binding outer membrane protein SusC
MKYRQHNTDWQDALFEQNVPILSHEIAVNGGSERSTYSSSLAFYFSQQGIIGGSKSQFERITARLNTRHEVNSFFHLW